MDRQLADHVIVEEHGQLADGRIGAWRRAAIEQERIGPDGDAKRLRQARR